MFYGYIGDSRGLSDVIPGLLQGRSGILELFVNRYFLSLKVQEGQVVEFKCDLNLAGKRSVNHYNLLVYCVAEMLANPEGFFAFYEDTRMKGIPLSNPVSGDELMIQATIVRKELDSIIEKVISPYAIFKALDKRAEVSFFEGKNVVEAISLAKAPIVSVVRRIKDLLSEGKLDIYEFREGEMTEELEIDYVMEKVPLKRVNILAILESLKTSSFSGIAKISSPTYTINLFYENGDIFAVYPPDFDLFEFLLSPDKNAELSLVSLDRSIVRFVALRYLGKPDIDTVSSNFMEISKLFLGLSKYKKNALLLISERKGDRFVIFREGRLVITLMEVDGTFKLSPSLLFEEPFFVSLYFFSKVDNIASKVYLFMINEIISIFMKHSPSKINSIVLREVAKYPFLVFSEGKIHLVKNPNEEEERQLLNLLSFMLDVSNQEFGEERQEEELELQLRPFKDIFKVLDVERYLKVRQ
ncbi:MAG: hypothetical protein Q9N26_08885 [Aquificota bacterium]|nr:hypothetical protein [Aquificota bacterium]